MKYLRYFLIIIALIIILLLQGKYIIERSRGIQVMKENSKKNILRTDKYEENKDSNNRYYKNFSFYKIVEAVYSINNKIKLSKIEKNSDNSFTLTVNFNNKEVPVKEVIDKLEKNKYFYKIDQINQSEDENIRITFVFTNQYKIEKSV